MKLAHASEIANLVNGFRRIHERQNNNKYGAITTVDDGDGAHSFIHENKNLFRSILFLIFTY